MQAAPPAGTHVLCHATGDGERGTSGGYDGPPLPPAAGPASAPGATPPPGTGDPAASASPQADTSPGVRAALAALRFYKDAISPLLPSVCRYLPTCSSYSMASYTQYGVARGTVLTAWRLMRCNPWGGRGYDPPAWPPAGLFSAALWEQAYAAEVACVVGVGAAAWLVQATWSDLLS